MAVAVVSVAGSLAAACTVPPDGADATTTSVATISVERPGAWRTPSARIDRTVLVGDSLAQESASVVQFLTPGRRFVAKYWGGTAPCDWVGTDLRASRSAVVAITFTGNSLTECMSDGRGGHLADHALVDRYTEDLAVLIDRSRRAGARVVLVGQPVRAASFSADVEVAGINAVLEAFAARYAYVSYVDAGAQVETADGRFTERLPCGAFDQTCDPDGTVVIRGDGVHFCPVVDTHPCPVWSSGAFRFGSAIADAVRRPRSYD
jgi:hypothetical protein